MTGTHPLRRKDAFFGIHFDLHPSERQGVCRALGPRPG
jgi:hypothetical protein